MEGDNGATKVMALLDSKKVLERGTRLYSYTEGLSAARSRMVIGYALTDTRDFCENGCGMLDSRSVLCKVLVEHRKGH